MNADIFNKERLCKRVSTKLINAVKYNFYIDNN